MTNHTSPCEHPCVLACPDTCALHPPAELQPIVLEEALARFHQEARPGICDTGRYRIPYYVWGEGPPLLFVHGISDSRLSFVQPISRLSAHFRCVAYDLPGMPGDGARFGHYRPEDLVADIWALLDHLNLKQSYVLGSSFGSMITLAALAERPERLPRAILQGGLAYRPLRRLERFLVRLIRWFPGSMKRLPLRRKIAEKVNRRSFAGRSESVWEYHLECCGLSPIATFAQQILMIHRLDLRPLLGRIHQPVLLLCGEYDRVVGPVHQEMLLDHLPNAGRVILAGCGHVPSYTHPEIMAEVIRQFLTPPPSKDLSASGTRDYAGP